MIFIIFSAYLRFLYELFTKIAFLLRKNWISFWAYGVEMLSIYFVLGCCYFVCLCVQQKKRGQKLQFVGVGCGCVWAWGCVGCGGCGGAWGVWQKLKKSDETQKKSTPPIKKIVTLPGRDTA